MFILNICSFKYIYPALNKFPIINENKASRNEKFVRLAYQFFLVVFMLKVTLLCYMFFMTFLMFNTAI